MLSSILYLTLFDNRYKSYTTEGMEGVEMATKGGEKHKLTKQEMDELTHMEKKGKKTLLNKEGSTRGNQGESEIEFHDNPMSNHPMTMANTQMKNMMNSARSLFGSDKSGMSAAANTKSEPGKRRRVERCV